MSENNLNKSSPGALIATVAVVLAAIAALAVLIVRSNTPNEEQQLPDGTVVDFKPSEELVDECAENAQRLLADNYTILRLFVTEGLPHVDEPYGNRPDDGMYTTNSADYTTYEEIEEFVKSCFVEAEATRILTQMPADPASGSGALIAVYQPRFSYLTKKTGIGINENFKPYTSYSKPWGSLIINIVPSSETECYVTVYLGAGEDADLSDVESGNVLTTQMKKENGEWRLAQLIY